MNNEISVIPPEPIFVGVVSNPVAVKGDKGEPFSSDIFLYPDAVFSVLINHNKGYYPNVSIIDEFNQRVIANEIFTNENQLIINFNSPFKGKIIIN